MFVFLFSFFFWRGGGGEEVIGGDTPNQKTNQCLEERCASVNRPPNTVCRRTDKWTTLSVSSVGYFFAPPCLLGYFFAPPCLLLLFYAGRFFSRVQL